MAGSLIPSPLSRGLAASDPFFALHQHVNQLFDAFLRGDASSPAGSLPRIDVRESDDEFCVVADLPGVAQADLDVRVHGNVVTISGERKAESETTNDEYRLVERSQGRFQRGLQLPFEPDPARIQASFRDGVLTMHVPKDGESPRSHRIEVRDGDERSEADGRAGASTLPADEPASAVSNSPDDVPEPGGAR